MIHFLVAWKQYICNMYQDPRFKDGKILYYLIGGLVIVTVMFVLEYFGVINT